MSKARDLADLAKNANDRLDDVATSDGALSNRNLIINGAMTVAQRGTSATGLTNTNSGYKALDRWRYVADNNFGQLVTKMEQVSDAPDDFVSSLKITVTTAETAIAGDEHFGVFQPIEAQDLQHLNYGTASAKQLTASFWVKSSIATTFSVGLYKMDTTSSMISKTYTVDTANTWEYKTITFDGLEGSGIDNNVNEGLRLWYTLGIGPDRVDADLTSWKNYAGDLSPVQFDGIGETLNATWQITGVQLEVGDTATPFEHRSYGDELARCMRYYEEWVAASGENVVIGTAYSGTNPHGVLQMKVIKRANPTVTLPPAGQTSGSISFLASNGGSPSTTGSHSVDRLNTRSVRVASTGYSGLNLGHASTIYAYGGGQSFKFDAEL